jgi:hypothetical protein
MFWIVAILLGVTYVAVLSLVLLFFAGAGRRNQSWDDSNDALWKERPRMDEERTA